MTIASIIEAKPLVSANVTEVLFRAGVLSANDVSDAMELSVCLNQSITKTLVTCGFISEKIVHFVSKLQALLKDGAISPALSLRALKEANDTGKEITQVLREMGWNPPGPGNGKVNYDHKLRIGELLRHAGLLSRVNLLTALEMSLHSRQPIGRILVERGLIDRGILQKALELQELVNQNVLTLPQSTIALHYFTAKRRSRPRLFPRRALA